jgi:hypothetical protein
MFNLLITCCVLIRKITVVCWIKASFSPGYVCVSVCSARLFCICVIHPLFLSITEYCKNLIVIRVLLFKRTEVLKCYVTKYELIINRSQAPVNKHDNVTKYLTMLLKKVAWKDEKYRLF